MPQKICVLGNTVADFIASHVKKLPRWGELVDIPEPIDLNIGGNGAISSTCLARLGMKPYLVSRIGDDDIGSQLLKKLEGSGVETSWTRRSRHTSTSATLVVVNSEGERMFFHHFGSNAELTSSAVKGFPMNDMSAMLMCSIFILPGMDATHTSKVLRSAVKNKVPTFMDVAWDPSGNWDLNGILEHVDFFMPNEDELMHITRTRSLSRAVERLYKLGQNIIIIKQGARGCSVAVDGKVKQKIKAPKVKALDTTGAGDAFNAGFIYAFLQTGDIPASAEFATFTASKTITGIGGSRNATSVREVKLFMSEKGGSVNFK